MSFQLEETTITAIHAAYRAEEITCADLVDRYLARVEAYDKQGPAINSIVTVNARAAEEARALARPSHAPRLSRGPCTESPWL